MEKIYSFDKGKTKLILAGTIQHRCGEKVFIKEAKASHFMKIKQAYGISCDVIDQLIYKYVNTIIIKTPAWTYHSTLGEWTTEQFIDDLGNGPQVFLPLNIMTQTSTTGE